MRTLLLTEVFPPRKGGSGRWLWELYRRLPDLDLHVAAGATAGDEAFDRTHQLRLRRLPLYFSNWGVWDLKGASHYLRALPGFAAALLRTRPQIIHCGKSLPEGILALLARRLGGIPFACYAHGEELTLATTSGQLRRWNQRVLAAASGVIANSEHTKALLVREWGVPAAKVRVMHPGVDTSVFVPEPRTAAARERLGWSGRTVVLTVGALQKRKGQDMMIRALPEIRRQCPDILYVMIGEGWERGYLDALVAECGVADAVQFRGIPSDDELIECYQQCDLFVLANRQVGWDFEGFGIVLLEAQACGRPVIAGRSGGAPETVDEGRSGELVSGDSPEAIAAAVTRLLHAPELREAMGARGRAWVVERFDWSVLTRQARDVFASIASD